jgi:hypothetical protein
MRFCLFLIAIGSKRESLWFCKGFDSAESTGLPSRPGPSVKHLHPIHMDE